MRIFRPIAIGILLVGTQLSAFAGEVAILRNGFSIHFDRKEQIGSSTRLHTGAGYMDIASDQIESFEAEEAPVTPPPPTVEADSQSTFQPAAQPLAASSQPAFAGNPAQNIDLEQVVREASNRNRIDPDFVSSVIKAESNFKTRAVSKKGAQGLMQLMPGTAAQLGVADAFDPKANVEAGTAHLGALLDQYHNDPIKALAAYNAGAHRVKQYNGVPPYRETRDYINKIVRDFNARKRAQMKAAAASKPAPSSKTAKTSPVKKPRRQQASVSKSVNPA
jgi:soluble lytic murein transglycosylase-like protein